MRIGLYKINWHSFSLIEAECNRGGSGGYSLLKGGVTPKQCCRVKARKLDTFFEKFLVEGGPIWEPVDLVEKSRGVRATTRVRSTSNGVRSTEWIRVRATIRSGGVRLLARVEEFQPEKASLRAPPDWKRQRAFPLLCFLWPPQGGIKYAGKRIDCHRQAREGSLREAHNAKDSEYAWEAPFPLIRPLTPNLWGGE